MGAGFDGGGAQSPPRRELMTLIRMTGNAQETFRTFALFVREQGNRTLGELHESLGREG